MMSPRRSVRLGDQFVLSRMELSADAARIFRRQADRADQEPEKKEGRDRCWHDVDRSVLPQFALHRPVHASSRESTGRLPALLRSAFDSIPVHWPAPCASWPDRFPSQGNKQVGDARCSHVAKLGQLLPSTIEQQDAAAERLAFVDRLERPRRRDLAGFTGTSNSATPLPPCCDRTRFGRDR